MAARNKLKTLPLNHPDRRAWSIDERRELYGFGRNYVYELIADGTLPTVKLRRRRFITREGDEQFRKNIGAAS